MQDRHEPLFAALTRVIFGSPGSLAPAMRRAIADGSTLPPALAPYAQKIREHAYRTEDADVTAIIEAGYTEDQVYELTVCAALGAGSRRMADGLRAIAESFAVMPDEPTVVLDEPAASTVDEPSAPYIPADAIDPAAPPLKRRVPRQATADTRAETGTEVTR